ncbi:RES family NAD+ phosphorylase [Thiocapsa sp.]|uniref:RES family NAD+ phosphorylase n=1 Tax=Thiocapsa sp. TaxID=2024551 RepID=UPI002CB0B9C4|nr:RES family NAD+ phosphorylase [Thiocapsa sp.]HSO82848.1 RES family NAD+ phosphorylase [Thiocapsa sp.]
MRWFRLLDEAYLETAFTGEGARLFGGRWNSPGVSMAYAAQSLSLAQLELLVHLEAEDVLRGHWRYIALEVVPEAILACELVAELPSDDTAWPAPASTRSIGDAWVASGVSVGLTVPSAVTPGERNLILNPAHPGFAAAVVIGEPRKLVMDQRLLKDAPT